MILFRMIIIKKALYLKRAFVKKIQIQKIIKVQVLWKKMQKFQVLKVVIKNSMKAQKIYQILTIQDSMKNKI